ncbi:DUF368 domain-containing protein [Saliphagus sp. LR7]|uniref:DUF368 domain-containing protein n=1 Tax=Saliphagus sp. LR7 TaxID=2282654 RepID=UPI001E2E3425|nr:DUF368 domain-containing protein [Saliphagus sp. LR7]
MSREPDGGEAPTAPESARQGAPSAAADSFRGWLGIYLTGLCMGAADIVPGVSGGTIALIAGIYDRFIAAIAGLDPRILTLVPGLASAEGRARFRDRLIELDVHFLVVLGVGVATAIVLLSRVIDAAFEAYPAVLNGFFFGLIAASAVVIYRVTDVDTRKRVGVLLGGAVLAFAVSASADPGGDAGLLLVFVGGTIAISAMVLPGISGSAFLYILGLYTYMTGTLTEFVDSLLSLAAGGSLSAVLEPGIPVVVFCVGAALGLLTMARVVKRALERNRMATLAFLVGLMVGALRLPVSRAVEETDVWTPELIAAVLAATLLGAVVVLGFDYYTDSLDYTEETVA